MPRGYRCILVAFVGWLSLANALNLRAAPKQPETQANQTSSTQPALPRANPAAPAESPELNRPCERGQDVRGSDLCAQWFAADAARKAADWTEWGFWLGLVGTAGLLATLYYTRAAVKAAQAATQDAEKALEIAERNADSTADLVRVSHENARKELRAYLDFDAVCWLREADQDTAEKIYTGVSFGVRNFGRTPARNVVSVVRYFGKGPDKPPELAGEIKEEIGMIAPTDTVTKNGYFHLPNWLWASIGVRKATLLAEIEINYVDDFGEKRSLASTFESFGHVSLGFVSGTRQAT